MQLQLVANILVKNIISQYNHEKTSANILVLSLIKSKNNHTNKISIKRFSFRNTYQIFQVNVKKTSQTLYLQ